LGILAGREGGGRGVDSFGLLLNLVLVVGDFSQHASAFVSSSKLFIILRTPTQEIGHEPRLVVLK